MRSHDSHPGLGSSRTRQLSCWPATADGKDELAANTAPTYSHGWAGDGAASERKQLDEFLLARALEHDAPGVLLQLACDWLLREHVVRPPVDTLNRRVATARDGARAETYHRLAPFAATTATDHPDGLLDVDVYLGITRLAWLRRGATTATPEVSKPSWTS